MTMVHIRSKAHHVDHTPDAESRWLLTANRLPEAGLLDSGQKTLRNFAPGGSKPH
jgi:hypothetical protein